MAELYKKMKSNRENHFYCLNSKIHEEKDAGKNCF